MKQELDKEAIQIKGLFKSYGNHDVIKNLSLDVHRGEIFALLGKNGAGKTTTLECVEGLRRYQKGEIKVSGKVGIQLQSSSLPDNIRPLEAIRLFSEWNHCKVNTQLISELGINELARKKYSDLSTGQKRRLHLALALTGDPDILFLDEPTAGLDVEGRISLHEQIRKLREQGKTIILASHDMAEVEDLCNRIGIIGNGTIVFVGTVEELNQTMRKSTIVYITIHDAQGEREERIETSDIAATLLDRLTQLKENNIEVTDIRIENNSLEQNFIEVTEEVNE